MSFFFTETTKNWTGYLANFPFLWLEWMISFLPIKLGYGWIITFNRIYCLLWCKDLTHWARVTHICVAELTLIVSDNGLSPERRQAIIWTKAWILLIGPYGTNFSEISIEIIIFSFTKMSLKGSPAKWRPFCLGLNELTKAISHITSRWLSARLQ